MDTERHWEDCVLLVDATRQGVAPELQARVAEHFRLVQVDAGDNKCLHNTIRRERPFAICIEHDHPTIGDLTALKELRRSHPSHPVIMITEQHSEALAIWALRARVWDYLVKPVDAEYLVVSLDALSRVVRSNKDRGRHIVQPQHVLPAETRWRKPAQSRTAVNQIVSYLERNLDQRVREEEVAALFRMSKFQFSRLFRRETGKTFQQFLLERRVEEAKRLLRHPSASVTDVCWTVGFNDASYFSRVFRRFVGTSPSQFRKRYVTGTESANLLRLPPEP